MFMKQGICAGFAPLLIVCTSFVLISPLYACGQAAGATVTQSAGKAQSASAGSDKNTSSTAANATDTNGKRTAQHSKPVLQAEKPAAVLPNTNKLAVYSEKPRKAVQSIPAVQPKPQSTKVQKTEHGQATQAVTAVDFEVLKTRLKNTTAIGFFTKLAIRNDIMDLMHQIQTYRKKAILDQKMKDVRASFDGLLLKIVALLEDDPDLSRDLYVGRESIWKSILEVKA